MGNACCNYAPKDPNALNFDNKRPQKVNNAEMAELLNHAKENEDKIVKI